ncbi:hypothetical protein VTN02DRAFT_3798 [Thermoascus thermophilus]
MRGRVGHYDWKPGPNQMTRLIKGDQLVVLLYQRQQEVLSDLFCDFLTRAFGTEHLKQALEPREYTIQVQEDGIPNIRDD